MSINLNPVYVIIAINSLVSFYCFNHPGLFDRLKFQVSAISNGQYYRIVSSGFLHVDFTHLLFNMITLFFFGDVVVSAFGVNAFYLIYFFCLIGGGIIGYQFHKNEPYYSAVGASGAVTGILYVSILLRPEMQMMILPIPFPIPAYWVGIGYMVYSIYGMQKPFGNIGHSAHFGGAISGLLTIMLLSPWVALRYPLIMALMILPVLYAVYLFRKRN